jgi:hypothetical protein
MLSQHFISREQNRSGMILILYRLSSESKNDIATLKELITSLEAKVNEMPSVATSLE